MSAEQSPKRAGDGIYPHETRAGTRYSFRYRKSDGRSARRGFTSPRAARRERERTVVSSAKGEPLDDRDLRRVLRQLARESPPVSGGGYLRRRGGPGAPPTGVALSKLSTQTVESRLALAVEKRGAPTTINNALATLVACPNDATREGKLPRNPAARVQRLPAAHIERDFLRLDEIPAYPGVCDAAYRPLAELVIATGLRISEALALGRRDDPSPGRRRGQVRA